MLVKNRLFLCVNYTHFLVLIIFTNEHENPTLNLWLETIFDCTKQAKDKSVTQDCSLEQNNFLFTNVCLYH